MATHQGTLYFQPVVYDNYTMIRLKDTNHIYSRLTYKIASDTNTDDVVYLYSIQTEERFQNRGYATVLLNHFVEKFDNYNILTKIMGGDDNIASNKLFNKFGFEQIILNSENFMIKYKTNIAQDDTVETDYYTDDEDDDSLQDSSDQESDTDLELVI